MNTDPKDKIQEAQELEDEGKYREAAEIYAAEGFPHMADACNEIADEQSEATDE